MTKAEIDKLPYSVKTKLMEAWNCDPGAVEKKLETMRRREVLDAYLKWEGIHGYTNVIAGICNVD